MTKGRARCAVESLTIESRESPGSQSALSTPRLQALDVRHPRVVGAPGRSHGCFDGSDSVLLVAQSVTVTGWLVVTSSDGLHLLYSSFLLLVAMASSAYEEFYGWILPPIPEF